MGVSRRRLLLLIGGAAVGMGLAACAAPPAPAPPAKPAPTAAPGAAAKAPPPSPAQPRRGGQLVMAIPSDVVPPLDPAQNRDNSTGLAINNTIFESLLTNEAGSIKLAPSLAERWEMSADGKQVTFKLRPNTKFHNGTACDAEAIKFNVERQTDKSNEYFQYGQFASARIAFEAVEKVTVVDPLTVRFDLSRPSLNFMVLGIQQQYVSPAAIKQHRADIVNNPVGTGPFKLKEWDKGVKFVVERFDQHWGGPPFLDQIIFVPVLDPQARLVAVKTGTAHFMIDVPVDSIADLERDPGFTVLKQPGRYTWGIILNIKNVEAFKDKRVRQAMNHAVNKEAIVRDILKNTGTVAEGPLSDIYGDARAVDKMKFPYNPSRAKELLTQAGYGNGFRVKLLIPESGPQMLQPVPMATLIQSNLAQVGVQVEIQAMEFASFNKLYLEGNFEMAGRSLRFSNHDSLSNAFHTKRFPPGFNTGFYSNPTFDSTVDQAGATPGEKGIDLYKQAERIIVEDAPWVWITHAFATYAVSNKVQGIQLRGDQALDFSKASFV